MSVLTISNLNKKLGNRNIINNISLAVEEGEVFGFLGPNGAGKTTTIKMILGLLSVDSGEIAVNGSSINKDFESALSDVAGIVENPDMYGYLSGLDNLKLYATARGNISTERINEVINQVGLSLRIKDKVKRYSLGMKQRLAIAICMLSRPKLLILDEPTNGLDPAGIKELRELMVHIAHEENMAVFVSSHLLTEMQMMCDRVCIINNGFIIGNYTISDLNNLNGKKAYKFKLKPMDKAHELIEANIPDRVAGYSDNGVELYCEGEEETAQLNAWLSSSGIMVFGIEANEGKLEDLYISLTKGGNQIV